MYGHSIASADLLCSGRRDHLFQKRVSRRGHPDSESRRSGPAGICAGAHRWVRRGSSRAGHERSRTQSLAEAVGDTACAISVQGWIKTAGRSFRDAYPHVEESGPETARAVVQIPWMPPEDDLRKISIASLGAEDLIGQGDLLERLVGNIPIVACTPGRDGADIYVDGRPTRVGTYVVDDRPTGAGDTFAGFIYGVTTGLDPVDAAMLGAAAASIVVEAVGKQAIHALHWKQGDERRASRKVGLMEWAGSLLGNRLQVPQSRSRRSPGKPPTVPPPLIDPMAQDTTWSTKNCTSAHPRAVHSPIHARLIMGGRERRSKQVNTHPTISRQLVTAHCPQSAGQLTQLSKSSSSHTPCPQTLQTPQSDRQLAQSSLPSQIRFPQFSQGPQSAGQRMLLSVS